VTVAFLFKESATTKMKATTPKGPQPMKPRHEREQEAVATREHARNSPASPAKHSLDAASILKREAASQAERIAFLAVASKDFHKSKANSLFLDTLSLKVPGGRVWGGYPLAVAATLLLAISTAAHAQGILTVTPSRTANTTAGTGTAGDTGDTGPATAATLANPSAVAYDSNGNLYLADANNHVIREVSTTGIITTIAGTGIEGFSGDGAAATAAQLDTPTGIAVDGSGNLYIADSHNHRIREVSNGNITTIAGTGTPGFSGDAAAATAAQLSLPSGVAVDKSGNLYIADTNNHRIREVSGGTINTIAGDGEELYAGDGAAATAAALDSPTSVAVDASGNVYIADRLNQRIRMVSNGIITTLAGTSTAGFSGDGAAATAATLAKPSGVSIDAAGNLYIADTDNQRIREVGGGAIATIEGSGSQGYGGDAGLSTAAILNSPRAVAPDALGNISIADQLNQRIRSGALPTLTFPSEDVGVPSPAQSVTLANTGTASITVATVTTSTGFTTATGGSCSALPITLSAGTSCTENLELLPVAAGPANGSVVFAGTGIVPQSILLTSSATQATTTLALTSNVSPALAGQPILYTAVVTPIGLGTPTGTVAFDVSGAAFSTQTLAPGSAIALAATSALATGTDSITAVYSGDANFTGSTSTTLPQLVEDFSITLTPQPNNPAGTTNQTVIPGKALTFDVALAPLLGPFNFPIVLSASGLPPGATVTFPPQTVTPGTTPSTSTMTIQTVVNQGSLHRGLPIGGGSIAFALLLLPFTRKLRQRATKLKRLHQTTLALTLLLCAAALGSITGCGTDTGFFAQPQQNYTITVTGTATGSNGYALQHSTTIKLTVQ
jgi:sugar lactone lactonase YvrE